MRRDLGDGLFLRQAERGDHAAMSRICLLTGDAGEDATAKEDEPELLALIYVLPYQVLEPDFAFVVDSPQGVLGYVVGTPDTRRFNERIEAEWYPALRARIATAPAEEAEWRGSDWARHMIHHPDYAIPPSLAPFPAHAHIDFLPAARGRGVGRRAMELIMDRLAAAGARGLHMPVSPRNEKALAFYARIGFTRLQGPDLPADTVFMGRPLP